ncbi:organic cation/carnitine transporter 2 [Brassica napus]|nr:organic cation/carnitine transporter 2 [Brassica napus]
MKFQEKKKSSLPCGKVKNNFCNKSRTKDSLHQMFSARQEQEKKVETPEPFMAEPTRPLLTDSNSLPPRSLDETIERYIGSFGWAQFLQATLVSFSGVFDAQQTFISVFTDFEPTWHCTESDSCHDSLSNICILPKTAWSWDLSPHVSVISEWSLQCSGSFVKGLPESSFFVGCLIGGLVLSTLADSSMGRKNMLFLSCLIMSISAMLTVFSPNVWVYAFLRFVNGFGRATVGTCALVLSTELVGKKWRGRVGIMSFFGFMLGFLSLPAMAYINRGNSWRVLYLWTSVPTMVYCVMVRFFVCESPRWLFVRGRREEAISILKRVASSDVAMSLPFEEQENIDEKPSVNIYAAMKVLVEKRWALKRLSTVMVVAFGIGLVYYGMPLALSNLDFNVYMSAAFNALMDLPANLITLFLVDKLSRRNALIGFTALGGVSSVLIFALQNLRINNHGALQLVLELMSYFCACSAFNVEMIYTIELFPTCVRNSAIAMARQALVLGGVFSPVMVAAGRKNGVWSFGLFGLAIGLLGLFTVGLPETRGSDLCDTMDEEECRDRRSNNDMASSVIA